MSDIVIRIEDSLRLVSTVLSLTQWNELIQRQRPHGTHAHIRSTARALGDFRHHPAVLSMQGLLDEGAPLEAMFGLVVHLPWPSLELATPPKWMPAGWNGQLADFYEQASVADWWMQDQSAWELAQRQAERVLGEVNFKPFLGQFFGEINESFVFYPNISLPSDRDLGIRQMSRNEIITMIPPRLAWGDSAPWPFDEDVAYVHRSALAQLVRLLLLAKLRDNPEVSKEASKISLPVSDTFRARYPTWAQQFVVIFTIAAVEIYLEQLDPKESKAYLQDQVRNHQMKWLPNTVDVLKRYMKEQERGKFESILDYLPIFPRQLKVAQRILSI